MTLIAQFCSLRPVVAIFLAAVLGSSCPWGFVATVAGDAISVEWEETLVREQNVVARVNPQISACPAIDRHAVTGNHTTVCLPTTFYSEHAARNGIGCPLTS